MFSLASRNSLVVRADAPSTTPSSAMAPKASATTVEVVLQVLGQLVGQAFQRLLGVGGGVLALDGGRREAAVGPQDLPAPRQAATASRCRPSRSRPVRPRTVPLPSPGRRSARPGRSSPQADQASGGDERERDGEMAEPWGHGSDGTQRPPATNLRPAGAAAPTAERRRG